ncbi:MAG: hypothetical protein H6918_09740 [Sphingomonadaceae bacterium]|nr:hypothetical protein [Sphingomonadaceae bacterium]
MRQILSFALCATLAAPAALAEPGDLGKGETEYQRAVRCAVINVDGAMMLIAHPDKSVMEKVVASADRWDRHAHKLGSSEAQTKSDFEAMDKAMKNITGPMDREEKAKTMAILLVDCAAAEKRVFGEG